MLLLHSLVRVPYGAEGCIALSARVFVQFRMALGLTALVQGLLGFRIWSCRDQVMTSGFRGRALSLVLLARVLQVS